MHTTHHTLPHHHTPPPQAPTPQPHTYHTHTPPHTTTTHHHTRRPGDGSGGLVLKLDSDLELLPWRWRTYASVRFGLLSCERACFSLRQEASFVLSHEEAPVIAPCQKATSPEDNPWSACSEVLRRSLFVFALVPVVSLMPCQFAWIR